MNLFSRRFSEENFWFKEDFLASEGWGKPGDRKREGKATKFEWREGKGELTVDFLCFRRRRGPENCKVSMILLSYSHFCSKKATKFKIFLYFKQVTRGSWFITYPNFIPNPLIIVDSLILTMNYGPPKKIP